MQPNEPAAWNNRGVANMGRRQYDAAVSDLQHAVQLSSVYAGAAGNLAIARYATGERAAAMREMRALLRRYPGFDDMRAALAAALWVEGERALAEDAWQRVGDARYKDATWALVDRRWPPPLTEALQALLSLR